MLTPRPYVLFFYQRMLWYDETPCAGSGRAFLFLSSCSHTPEKPTEAQEEQRSEERVESCLTSSTMSLSWGECNVQKTVYDALPKMGHCLKGKYNGAGELQANILVGKSGKVKAAHAALNSVKNKKVTGCLLSEMKKLKFAAPPAGSKPSVLVPLSVRDIVASQLNN